MRMAWEVGSCVYPMESGQSTRAAPAAPASDARIAGSMLEKASSVPRCLTTYVSNASASAALRRRRCDKRKTCRKRDLLNTATHTT